MNKVTDLLKVNQILRQENYDWEESVREKNIECYELKEESEELRDRIEILEAIISTDEERLTEYLSKFVKKKVIESNYEETGEKFVTPIDRMYEEMIELRNKVKGLERRN